MSDTETIPAATTEPKKKTTPTVARSSERGETDKSDRASAKEPDLATLFAPIVAELQVGNAKALQPGNPGLGNKLSPRAAALLCGHLIHEKGVEEAACMTRPEARAWADGFSKRFPAAWGAIVKQDLLRFVRVLNAFGERTNDEKGYQSMAEKLLKVSATP